MRRISGREAVQRALEAGAEVRLLLVDENAGSGALLRLLEGARSRGIAVRTATRRVMQRFSERAPAEVLALVGRDPDAGVEQMLAAGGAVWLLVGVAYPGNVGMAIRTAEVSGAEGIAIQADFDHEGRRAALRASMRADRFMPVHWCGPGIVLDAAERLGHSVFALDEAGESAPWQLDLTGGRVFVVGGETGGIPDETLRRCHARIRVPMAGFIPCYNLQAAVSAVAAERLRQQAD